MAAPPNTSEASAQVADAQTREVPAFAVALENFSGPFDLLLNLIGKRELDITEVALATVTDEFIAYIRAMDGVDGDHENFTPAALDQASQFVVVAATLLDLKAARLLPQGEVESDEDIAALEARDLLFARLLQYKAFKEVAALMGQIMTQQANSVPRLVPLDPEFASLLPELIFTHTPEQFAHIASKALEPKQPMPTDVGLAHLHAPAVSVREQAEIVTRKLHGGEAMSFRALVADAADTLTVVARFLALLELFRDAVVAFDQAAPLGELYVRLSADPANLEARPASEYDAEPSLLADEAYSAIDDTRPAPVLSAAEPTGPTSPKRNSDE